MTKTCDIYRIHKYFATPTCFFVCLFVCVCALLCFFGGKGGLFLLLLVVCFTQIINATAHNLCETPWHHIQLCGKFCAYECCQQPKLKNWRRKKTRGKLYSPEAFLLLFSQAVVRDQLWWWAELLFPEKQSHFPLHKTPSPLSPILSFLFSSFFFWCVFLFCFQQLYYHVCTMYVDSLLAFIRVSCEERGD